MQLLIVISFAHSHPFRFLVGPEKASIYVHSDLVEQHSRTLGALVSGGMTEAAERCAYLEDIDETTFIQFVEYAYTGDYSVPEPGLDPDHADDVHGHSPGSPANDEVEHADEGSPMTRYEEWPPKKVVSKPSKMSKSRARRRNQWVQSSDEEIVFPPEPVPEPRFGVDEQRESKWWQEFKSKAQPREIPAWQPRVNERSNEDYRPIFLCHASLYVFSDQYSIETLQELVLQKLRLTLVKFKLFPERTGDVVELLKYTYANTMDHDSGIDKLRGLVTDYVVCKIQAFVTNPNFLEYFKEEGFAAKDLIVKLAQRLQPEAEVEVE